MLVEYLRATDRVNSPQMDWVVPPLGWMGLIIPSVRTNWHTWRGVTGHVSVELAGGFVPTIALTIVAILALRRFWKANVAEMGLLITSLAFAMSPSIGTFRWSFRWLPLVHLVLAIIGARALEMIEEIRPRRLPTAQLIVTRWNPGVWAMGLIVNRAQRFAER